MGRVSEATDRNGADVTGSVQGYPLLHKYTIIYSLS